MGSDELEPLLWRHAPAAQSTPDAQASGDAEHTVTLSELSEGVDALERQAPCWPFHVPLLLERS